MKIFPGSLSGPAYFNSLRGPFPHIPMIPIRGVSLENVGDWFAADSELWPKHLVEAGEFDKISDSAHRFVEAIQKARKPK